MHAECQKKKKKRYIYWDILDTYKGSCSLNKHKKLLQCHNTNATARAWKVATSTIPEITVYIKKLSVQPAPFCTIHTLTLLVGSHHQPTKIIERMTKTKPNLPLIFQYEILPWLNSSGFLKKAEAWMLQS